MTVQEMFAAAATTKSAHPGYKVYLPGGRVLGPYSYQVARDVAADLHGEYLQDMATGELLDP